MPELAAATPWLAIVGAVAAAIVIGGVLVSIGIWIGSVNANLKTFKDAVGEIKEAVDKIRDTTNSVLHELTSKTLAPGSPLEPNELGKKVSEAIGVPSIVKGLAAGLSEKAEGKHPYDIQELCFNFVRDDYEPSDEVEKNIKEFAYKNGISRADVMDVLAVELRDEILRLIEQKA